MRIYKDLQDLESDRVHNFATLNDCFTCFGGELSQRLVAGKSSVLLSSKITSNHQSTL